MANSGPDGLLSKWCLSLMESSCSDSELPALPELGLSESPPDVSLHTTAKSLSAFYLKFVEAKMRSQSTRDRNDVVSCLAYAAGLCVTREFVTELLKELLTEGVSPHLSQHHYASDCQHMQHNECSNEGGNYNLPLEGTARSEINVETVKVEVNEDSVMKEETETVAADGKRRGVGTALPHRRHFYYMSKNVPPTYALCMRGVKCKVCGNIFKGMTCVDDLSNHVKKAHRKKATARFLKQIREENTVERIIGPGMTWCECCTCDFLAKSHGWIR